MKNVATYPERESRILEFKACIPKNLQTLVKTCIAFANGSGGKIIIGVTNRTREITGISEKDRDRIYDSFPNSLYDSTSPNLFAQIYEKNFNDVSVLIIEVPVCLKKPYFLKNEGIPEGVYIRIGSSTRKANREYVEDLIREGRRLSFDEEAVNGDISILSHPLLKNLYATNIVPRRLLAEKIVTQSFQDGKKLSPTVAGTLLFCDSPEKFIPEAFIICTRFSGDKPRDIIQTEEITGDLEKQADVSFKLIKSWLEKNYQLKGVKLKGSLPIPEEALREAIINALIHRKYSIPGAIKVALYPDRLEIFNPGGFPGLVDINNLGDGTTYLRNPVLARIAHKLGLVEKLGSGIRLIFDSCRQLGLKKPVYNDNGDFVKITFYFELSHDVKKCEEESLLHLLQAKHDISIKDVMQYLNVSRNTATRYLNRLIKKKLIIRIGKGPTTKFMVTG